jgi:Protein of unknown function (DUF3822)
MQTENATILNKTYQKLILQVSQTEVSFCIFDSLRNRIENLQSVAFDKILTPSEIELKLVDLFQNSSYFSKKFDDVLVFHNNNLLTFVPHVLFDEAYMSSYLQYNTKVFESDFFANDAVSNYELNTVYIPYVNINNFLIDRFGSFNYKHSFTYLVKKVLDFSKNIDETEMYVHIQETNFQIIVAKNQQLILFNTFDYKTEEDFIYYLLFTAEQLNLNPETTKLKLFGNVSKESNLYQIAYKYIRNVSLFLDHNNLENGISQQDYLKHFILIHACE